MGTYKKAKKTSRGQGNYQGMNWIRQEKRLAIYLRDGLACAYCGVSVEEGAQLTLDHIKPHSLGGTNKETNLVTCCLKCNSSRGNRTMEEFRSCLSYFLLIKMRDFLSRQGAKSEVWQRQTRISATQD